MRVCRNKFAALGKIAKKLICVIVALRMDRFKNDGARNVVHNSVHWIVDYLLDGCFEIVSFLQNSSVRNTYSYPRSTRRCYPHADNAGQHVSPTLSKLIRRFHGYLPWRAIVWCS
jgi:hypothetical protein